MTEVKINEVAYPVPTSWNDVTFAKYCDVIQSKGKPLSERLSCYSGIPIEIVNKFTLSQNRCVSDFVEFMDFPDLIDAFAMAYESKLVIGDEMYWRVENAKQVIQKATLPICAGAEVVKIFTADEDGNGGEEIGGEPVTKVIGRVAFFLSSCQSFGTGSNVSTTTNRVRTK